MWQEQEDAALERGGCQPGAAGQVGRSDEGSVLNIIVRSSSVSEHNPKQKIATFKAIILWYLGISFNISNTVKR